MVNKKSGEIVQGDKTGDTPLSTVMADYISKRDNKPGKAFIGVPHRLDRPVSGVVIFAKTSKALSRFSNLFREGGVDKRYWAIVSGKVISESDKLIDYLIKDEASNKSYVTTQDRRGAKEAHLEYKLLMRGDNYNLLEIKLLTGRHHQIRAQLANRGLIIKGDLKYGAKRSNPDGSISLHSRSASFIHPVKGELVEIIAPVPNESLWNWFEDSLTSQKG